MFGTMKSGANAYAKVGVETGVMAASPHKLIVMLFEGAMVAVATAAKQMASGDIAGKGKSISKAISIIEEGLRASLDRKAGGEIAANLDSLYQYMNTRLVIANRDNQAEILEEVLRLLGELKGAWEQIAPGETKAQTAQPSLPPMQAAGAVLMRA
jgi:flagellar protein FliS